MIIKNRVFLLDFLETLLIKLLKFKAKMSKEKYNKVYKLNIFTLFETLLSSIFSHDD